MDERPDVGGYESHAIWIRRVEDIDGEWRLLATGVDSVLWSDDGKEMVFTDDALVTWQTFSSAELIGRWDTGEFSTHPVAWSPNGHFLVTEGNVPGEWQYGLFVLERSLVAAPAPQSTPSPSPEPAQGGHGVTPPPGLVYRTLDGLWRVDADGQPQQLLTNPDAQLSPDGQRALHWDGTGIWVVDLTTGAEYNLLAGNDRPTCCPQWADAETILFGYWPEGTEPGPSTGYLSAATIDSSWVRVLNESSASNGLPAASPDGGVIAYDQGGTAWLYRWGSGPELFDLAVYDLPQSKSLKIGSPAWSPDGRKLAWIVGGGFGPGGGYRIGVAIFDLEAKTAQLRHLYEPIGVGGWPPAPAWSPDGQWLALVAWEWVPEGPQGGNLWLLSADGSVQDQLLLKAVGLGGRPVWSPDGRWLLFTRQVTGKETAVWRFETGVWQPQQLELPFDATVLAWTPFTLDGVFFDHQGWYYDSARVVSER
jgi:dipeptidyl aminopeptidase/acylaminoacyl peptidase